MALAVGIICVPRVYSILTQSTEIKTQTAFIMALAVGIICVPRVYNILTQSTQTDGRYYGSGSRYNLCT